MAEQTTPDAGGPVNRPPGPAAAKRDPSGQPAQAQEASNVMVPAGDGAALDPGAENEVWTGRTHWKHYAVSILLGLLAGIVLALGFIWLASAMESFSTGLALLLGFVGLVLIELPILGRIFFKIIGTRYRLTTQRLFIERGILSQTVDQTELIRVDDVRLHKTLLDRLCGLGSVEVMSTDATDGHLMITGVAGPEPIAESIRQHMRAMRKKSLFVESL